MIHIIIWLFIFLGLVPYPTGTTTAAQLVTDFLAVLALSSTAGVVLRHCPRAAWSAIVLLAVGLFWMLLGVIADAPEIARIWSDFRGLLRMSAVIFAVSWLWVRLGGVETLRRFFTLALVVGLYSVFALLLTLAGSSMFAVRADSASLWAGSYSSLSTALRVSLPSGLLLVVAGVVAFYLLSIRSTLVPTGKLVTIGVIALLVATTSYSRSFFLLAAIAIGLLLILGPRRRRLFSMLVGAGAIGSLMLFMVYATSTVFVWSAWEELSGVLQAYAGRVVNGLDPAALAADSSASWRTRESSVAMEHVQANWLAGSGFGVPYRSSMNGEIFNGTYGLTYVHSAYLWVLVKTGVLGTLALAGVAFVGLLNLCVARIQGKDSAAASVVGAVAVAIAITMLASPVPFDASGSIVVGGVLGASLILGHQAQSSRRKLDVATKSGHAPTRRSDGKWRSSQRYYAGRGT